MLGKSLWRAIFYSMGSQLTGSNQSTDICQAARQKQKGTGLKEEWRQGPAAELAARCNRVAFDSLLLIQGSLFLKHLPILQNSATKKRSSRLLLPRYYKMSPLIYTTVHPTPVEQNYLLDLLVEPRKTRWCFLWMSQGCTDTWALSWELITATLHSWQFLIKIEQSTENFCHIPNNTIKAQSERYFTEQKPCREF